MVKVKAISRSTSSCVRETTTDMFKVHKNPDPQLHPFERAREYVRALNATKLEKVFAKPFLAALSGHPDGIYSIARHPFMLPCFITGGSCGEIRVWDVSRRVCTSEIQAHTGFVRGIAFANGGRTFFTAGADNCVKQWPLLFREETESGVKPLATYLSDQPFMHIDHQRMEPIFATASTGVVQIWTHTRSSPIEAYQWGSDTVHCVRFNPVETSILASTAGDRSVALYDLRGKTPIRKLVLEMKSNSISWNPMEAYHFTVANEDHNLYTFDTRNLQKAVMVHLDHVGPVYGLFTCTFSLGRIDLDYSPTGREFVSGSYDKTIRIFSVDSARSREVYHTKRMQKIFVVKFSMDSRYVLSGSDDGNLRLWKAQAAEPIKIMSRREEEKLNYQEKLKKRFQNLPEISRIQHHRHVPRHILKIRRIKQEMKKAVKRKQYNVERHTAQTLKGKFDKTKRERQKHIVATLT